MLKKRIACTLAALLLLGMLGGCSAAEQTPSTEPKETQSEEEKNVLKILTLGSSSTVDACHMLNLVAAAEGVEQELVVGTLYYSGCTLTQHIQFLTQNSNVYSLYVSSTATPEQPPKIMDNVTMLNALQYEPWDIIVIQPGGGEALTDETYTSDKIQTIKDYVNKNKRNPEAVFAYHGIAAGSTDPELTAKYPYSPNSYAAAAEKYNYDRAAWYAERSDRLKRFVMTDESYVYRFLSCTTVENAITSYLGEKGIKRDYTHRTDIGRLMVAYTWYCELYGIQELTELKVESIPKAFLKSTANKSEDLVLTDMEKAVILEAVNNTIKNPVEITQSQYTQAPEA